ALEAFLYALFQNAISFTEDYAFFQGNGVGKPLGAVNSAGFIQATRSGANLFALADYAAILSRWLPNYDPAAACWSCHPTVLAKLYQLQATNSIPMFIASAREKPRHVLAGLPLEVTEKCPALGTPGDIFLADWSKYVIGDRQQYEIAFSKDYLFNK